MAKTQDLVVKMTINSSDFDNGLKNAKASMSKFNQSTISASNLFKKAMGGMVKAFGTVGVAVGGAEMFKSFIKSTQTIGDKWNNTMVTARTSFQVFESAVMTGNGNILANFRQSISAAREFAEAMDAFGSAQISNQYARMQYVTPFNEAMTKYRSMKSSGNETGMAFAAADMKRYIEAYSDNAAILMNKSMEAVTAKLSSYTGGFINSGNVRKYLDQLYLELVNGVFPPAVQELKELRSEKNFTKAAQMAAAYTAKWGADVVNESDALLQLSEINDDTLKELLGILKTYDSVRNEINSMRRQMNRAMNGEKSATTTTTGSTTYTAPTRTPVETVPTLVPISPVTDDTLQRMDALGKKLQEMNEVSQETLLINDLMAQIWQQHIDKLTTYADVIGTCGNAFASLSDAIGDTPFGKFVATLGAVAIQIQSLTQTYASLIAVEAVAESIKAGTGIPFPYNLVMIAAAAASLAAIIATAKNNFAGSFAEGGIVGGNSYTGDKLIARVNSGEMILNRNQQAALFGASGNVNFVIEGSQLRGVLDNYEKISSL